MKLKTYYLSVIAVAVFSFGLLTSNASAQVEGAAITAIAEPAEASGGASAQLSSGTSRSSAPSTSSRRSSRRTKRTATVKPPAPPKPAKWDGFVIGDKYTFMNFEVVSAEKPYHTRAAIAQNASGLVQVEILIDTTGKVLTARARTGNKLLHPEAERAALASKFNRPTVYGKPARAIGFLVYRFGSADPD